MFEIVTESTSTVDIYVFYFTRTPTLYKLVVC